MPKISIVCPTIRRDGLRVVYESLKKQTFKNWEFLVGSKFDPEIPEAIWVRDDFKGGYWSLNRIYNRLFDRCSSDLIVSWQDNIWIPSDGLEKFVINATAYPGAVITGVGDQYEKINKWGKPEIKIWSDPRKTNKFGSFYECFPNDAEWNWCIIPKLRLVAVGGMDEELDFLGYGGDQLQVGERLDAIGTKFFIDQTNESYTVRHGREDFGGEEKWNKDHILFNGKYDKRKKELIEKGKWPCIK